MTVEGDRVAGFGRLEDGLKQASPGSTWGPYVSERQWGTVREDYSEDGDAWNYLPFDHARSRAYRWGEDGLAGFGDIHQNLCVGLALRNGRDASLKERLRAENRRRDRRSAEYEILDAGRYWVTEVRVAKRDDAAELLIEVTVTNAGPEADTVHVLPTAWFRNPWSWDGSGNKLTVAEIAEDLRVRLISIFTRGADGRRPCYGWVDKLS